MRDPFWIFFFGELLCVTLCASPTHFGRRCQEVFSPMSFSSNSGKQHNTFRHSRCTVWRPAKECEETGKQKKQKKPPLLISAKCVSFTARFKLMALILSAPKNPRYNANFQCHWIRLRVWRRRRRAEKGWGCGCGGREWEEEGGLRLQWMSPYLLSQSSTFNPSPSRGLWDSLAMMPVKWDQ